MWHFFGFQRSCDVALCFLNNFTLDKLIFKAVIMKLKGLFLIATLLVLVIILYLQTDYKSSASIPLATKQVKINTVISDPQRIPPIQTDFAKNAEDSDTQIKAKPIKQFSSLQVIKTEKNAYDLYQRLRGKKLSLDDSAVLAEYAGAIETCWISHRYTRIARSVTSEIDPDLHGQANQIALEEKNKSSGICKNLPNDAFAKNDQWISELAEMGDHRAMYLFVHNTMWIRDTDILYQRAEEIVEYKKKIKSYLETLSNNPYPEALMSMGLMKANPLMGEVNQIEAWGYLYAAALARSDVPTQARLIENLNQKVGNENRDAAISFAKLTYQRCCVK